MLMRITTAVETKTCKSHHPPIWPFGWSRFRVFQVRLLNLSQHSYPDNIRHLQSARDLLDVLPRHGLSEFILKAAHARANAFLTFVSVFAVGCAQLHDGILATST